MPGKPFSEEENKNNLNWVLDWLQTFAIRIKVESFTTRIKVHCARIVGYEKELRNLRVWDVRNPDPLERRRSFEEFERESQAIIKNQDQERRCLLRCPEIRRL